MKPTVITNNSNGSSNGNAPTATTTTNASSGGVGQTPQHHHTSSTTMDPNNNPNVRHQFQNFEGFGFDPDMDDVFSDSGIRSRLNRMPFSFGSRKRVNDPNRYFNTDDDDFFSHFGSLGRRRHPQTDRSGIFEHIPAEFRQYMPDAFEFPSTMRNTPQSPRYSASQPTQNPPQYYETYTQPGSGSPTANQPQPKPQKPRLCDAAIQTENSLDETTQHPNKTHKTQPLKQHGLRNTVDLGQISPPENESSPRAQSAPPIDPSKQNFTNSSVASGPDPDQTHASATAYAYIPPPQQQRWQPQPQSPPPSAQHKPQIPHLPPRSMPQQQYYQSAAQSPQPQSSSQPGSATIRTVPIFVEGRSEPVINEQKYPTFESHPSTQQEVPPHVQKQFYPQQHSSQYQQPQASQYQPYQQYQQQSHPQQPHPQQQAPRPTPLNTQQANAASDQQSPVPNTPQTTATIEKIQSIQRDVLNLMSKVEKFKGMKADKEYMYLDEMLTRNLLKLDTIDTQGKERIRLARKEAIKCIQASINVLEAKAEENAKTAQKSVMNAQDEINTSTVPQTEKTENIYNDTRITKIPTTATVLDEASTAKLPDVVPLPPPPSPPQSQPQPSSTNQLTSENQQMTENEEKSNSDQNIVELEIEKQQEQPKSEDSKTNKTEAEIINTEQKQHNEDESTSALQSNNDDTTTNNVPTPIIVAVDQQENKERSKESPKKKIIKKIIKKSEKKDKKESAAAKPSSETQEIATTSSPPSEISKDCN